MPTLRKNTLYATDVTKSSHLLLYLTGTLVLNRNTSGQTYLTKFSLPALPAFLARQAPTAIWNLETVAIHGASAVHAGDDHLTVLSDTSGVLRLAVCHRKISREDAWQILGLISELAGVVCSSGLFLRTLQPESLRAVPPLSRAALIAGGER